MKRFLSLVVACSCLIGSSIQSTSAAEEHKPSDGSLVAELEKDPVLRALVDEMERSKSKLKFESHPTPYYVSYWIKQVDEVNISSNLGSKAAVERLTSRILIPVVRIGNYELDSSYPHTSRPEPVVSVQIDDDYSAIRRAAWLGTDAAYKTSITNFEWKKNYLATNNIPHRLADMTKEPPVVAINPVRSVVVDEAKWCNNVQEISSTFNKYKSLQRSRVTLNCTTTTDWHVNSEGTVVRDSHDKAILKLWASGQSDDGFANTDSEVIGAPLASQLPPLHSLKKAADTFANRLSELNVAPRADGYCGPVLFEGQAAAQFFSQILVPNFGFAEDYVGAEDFRNPLTRMVGRKILPPFMSVIDDPASKEYKGIPLVGGYNFDQDGVPAQKVTIAQNGVLKGFCQSRIPIRNSNRSNGHSVGGHGVPNIIRIESDATLSDGELQKKYTELAKDAGLDHILVIERLSDSYELTEYPFGSERPYATPSYSRAPSDPIVAYRLYLADGRKELVRGLEFTYVSLRSFRDIQGVKGDEAPYLVEPEDGAVRHLIAPTYLIGELELLPIKSENSRPPTMESPLSESARSEGIEAGKALKSTK